MTTVPVQHARYGRGTSTSIITQGVRRMHTTFVTGTEMIEEYDATTEHLKCQPHPSPPPPPPLLTRPS